MDSWHLPQNQTEALARQIHEAVYRQLSEYKTTIFLCGAGTDTNPSVRETIDVRLRQDRFFYRYEIYYPEDLFGELLVGAGHQDLISLENILAESVDAVVLVVESMGAVAELGSFASNDSLRPKLVAVVDKKYRKASSFINLGPLRLIKDRKQGILVFGDFSHPETLVDPIRRAVQKLGRNSAPVKGVENVVDAHHYVISSIYLLEPVEVALLTNLVQFASGRDQSTARALTIGALSVLTKRGEIQLQSDGYHLSPAGVQVFMRLGKRGKRRHTYDLQSMDAMRVKILNSRLRHKHVDFAE